MAPPQVVVTIVRAGHPKVQRAVEAATPGELVLAIARDMPDLDLDAHHVRLIHKGKNISPDGESPRLKDGAKVTCMLSSKATAARIASTCSPDDRVPSTEYEYERDRKRASTSGANQGKINPRIGALATFKYPARVALTPSAAAAEELLRSIATDAGVVHVMDAYGWSVGVLSELPPEGYVGVSPVCLLGLNVDKGREIKLRLRTDDMRGFRKRHAIIETMLHELAHNVVEGHGLEFKELNSRLRKMYDGWMACGRSLAGQGAVRDGREVHGSLRTSDGGGGGGGDRGTGDGTRQEARRTGGARPSLAPGEAARKAALARSFSHPTLEEFVEKEHVMYYNKQTDEYVDAIITAIDRTITPHSITIDLFSNGLDRPATSVGRETEASRLSKRLSE